MNYLLNALRPLICFPFEVHKSQLVFANIFNPFTERLPDNWNDVSEMVQLQPLDRSFLFPGMCSPCDFSSDVPYYCTLLDTYFLELTWFSYQASRFIYWHACQLLSKIYRLYPPSELLR
jgi:hypothetical protein